MRHKTKRGLGSSAIDPNTKLQIQQKGGHVSAKKQDMSTLGRKGGKAAQNSGKAHKLTTKERSQGGLHSSQKQDMSALGQKGGKARHVKTTDDWYEKLEEELKGYT